MKPRKASFEKQECRLSLAMLCPPRICSILFWSILTTLAQKYLEYPRLGAGSSDNMHTWWVLKTTGKSMQKQWTETITSPLIKTNMSNQRIEIVEFWLESILNNGLNMLNATSSTSTKTSTDNYSVFSSLILSPSAWLQMLKLLCTAQHLASSKTSIIGAP